MRAGAHMHNQEIDETYYRDGQSNSTTFVMAPTIIFGNFRPCHCVQNSEIHPKPDFGGFRGVANFWAGKSGA